MNFQETGTDGADGGGDGMPDNPFADGDASNGRMAGETSSWMDRFRNRNPNPPIDEVGSFDDIKTKYDKYGLRGLQKLGGVDDTEAWVDLLKFAIGATMAYTDTEEISVTDSSDEDDGETSPNGVERAGQVPSIDEMEGGP